MISFLKRKFFTSKKEQPAVQPPSLDMAFPNTSNQPRPVLNSKNQLVGEVATNNCYEKEENKKELSPFS
jgi:hypothetical protein